MSELTCSGDRTARWCLCHCVCVCVSCDDTICDTHTRYDKKVIDIGQWRTRVTHCSTDHDHCDAVVILCLSVNLPWYLTFVIFVGYITTLLLLLVLWNNIIFPYMYLMEMWKLLVTMIVTFCQIWRVNVWNICYSYWYGFRIVHSIDIHYSKPLTLTVTYTTVQNW